MLYYKSLYSGARGDKNILTLLATKKKRTVLERSLLRKKMLKNQIEALKNVHCILVVYKCCSLLQLAPGSRYLSQAHKRITVWKAE
jgi:hypothetical protein